MALRVKKNFDLAKRLAVIYKGDFRSFLKPAGEIIVDNIIDNIKHQVTPEGGRLKKNKAETLRIKKRMGKGTLSLIWDRLLISKSTWYQKTSKKRAIIGLIKERKNIGRALEKMGYRFFGISPLARAYILVRWRKFIKRGLR